jgi:hydroxymethylpyrimidine/phosphomethylpyrimidine kinase
VIAPPRILVIAGSDSSGGAGIQADVKTITMLGGYAMTAITAVTAQNTVGVQAVELLPAKFVAAQINSCLGDIGADAVKIGMLGSADIAHAVADRLEGFSGPIVFDPVMIATSGAVLADEGTIAAFARLMQMAAVVTPNVPELKVLTAALDPAGDVAALAALLATQHSCFVLAKGGHNEGIEVVDMLAGADGTMIRHRNPRIDTRHTHGTGCTLASAIATELAHGRALNDAVGAGIAFVRSALRSAPGFGAGAGPLGHHCVNRSEAVDAG